MLHIFQFKGLLMLYGGYVMHCTSKSYIAPDDSTNQKTVFVEVDFDELPESRGVIVPNGASVTECLQNWITL